MRSRALRTAICFGLVAASVGCGGVARPLVTRAGDFADYRETRVAGSLDARLAAAARYLDAHRDGAYRDEVAAWFERVEPLFYESRKETIASLRSYLDALPDGPHAPEALARIAALEKKRRSQQGERLAKTAATFEERLARAADARAAVVEAYTGWIGLVVAMGAWGRPTWEADGEFLYAFRTDPPAGRCEGEICRKLLSLPYTLRSEGKAEEREATIEIELRLVQGRIDSATIAGPELFTRLAEVHEARPMKSGDAAERVAAIGWAVELTGGALEAKLPAARCSKPFVAPIVLERACDGWSARLVAATEPGQDDRLELRGPAAP